MFCRSYSNSAWKLGSANITFPLKWWFVQIGSLPFPLHSAQHMVAKGIATSSKGIVAPGLATRNKKLLVTRPIIVLIIRVYST